MNDDKIYISLSKPLKTDINLRPKFRANTYKDFKSHIFFQAGLYAQYGRIPAGSAFGPSEKNDDVSFNDPLPGDQVPRRYKSIPKEV